MGRQEHLVVWQEAYSLGVDELDDQHRELFAIMNRLWSAIVRKAEGREMAGIIGELEHFTAVHFSHEENLMRRSEYPLYAEHRAYHRSFIQRLADEKAAAEAEEKVSLGLLQFLRDWLVNHILVNDRAYAEYSGHHLPRARGMLGRFLQSLR